MSLAAGAGRLRGRQKLSSASITSSPVRSPLSVRSSVSGTRLGQEDMVRTRGAPEVASALRSEEGHEAAVSLIA